MVPLYSETLAKIIRAELHGSVAHLEAGGIHFKAVLGFKRRSQDLETMWDKPLIFSILAN